MWPESPEQALIRIKQRQADIRAEVAAGRIRPARETGSRTYRFWGVRLHVGSFLLVAGRSLYDDDARLLRPTH
jgi:hypothetical protein